MPDNSKQGEVEPQHEQAGSRRGGRPSKPPGQTRSESKTVKYTPGELALLERRAAAAGAKVAPFIRRASLGRRLEPNAKAEALKSVRRELRAIGKNLNQLTRYAHSERRRGGRLDAAELEGAISELRHYLKSLR